MNKHTHFGVVSVLGVILAISGIACGEEPSDPESASTAREGCAGDKDCSHPSNTTSSPVTDEDIARTNGEPGSEPTFGGAGGAATGGAATGGAATGGAATGSAGTPVVTTGSASSSIERALAAKLGLPARFAIGLGNDADQGSDATRMSAYLLGPKLDIHYMYLSGLPGENGWTDWNAPSGSYVTLHVNAAKARGVVPMFTLYQSGAWGDGNLGAFNDVAFMTKYWRGVRTMFERLGATGVPAIVHVEPDFWGYAQRKGEPSAVPVKVGALVQECTDLPADVSGFGRCVVRLGRQLSPKVVIGLHASQFGALTNGVPDPARVAKYMDQVGGAETDITVIETLDRDAGCFEAAVDARCKRTGTFYWDESNARHPNFHDHLAWAKTIRQVGKKPILWWQTPLGVPAGSAGSSSQYRDNRVKYLFAHADEFAAAGGIGAVFGPGAPNQTTTKTDGGQFKNAVTKYLAAGGAALN